MLLVLAFALLGTSLYGTFKDRLPHSRKHACPITPSGTWTAVNGGPSALRCLRPRPGARLALLHTLA